MRLVPVIRIRVERDMVPAHPFRELERAGPNRVGAEVLPVLLERRRTRNTAGWMGNGCYQRSERLGGNEPDCRVVNSFNVIDRSAEVAVPFQLRVRSQNPCKGSLTCRRIEGAAIMEFDALLQLERERLGVRRWLPRFSQLVDDVHVLVEADQTFMQALVGPERRVEERVMNVQRVRLNIERDEERPIDKRGGCWRGRDCRRANCLSDECRNCRGTRLSWRGSGRRLGRRRLSARCNDAREC